MTSPDLSVQVVIALAIGGTALMGVMVVSIYLCSQTFRKSREAYRIQRASSLHNKGPEAAQRRTTPTQDEYTILSPPHRSQHSPPHWPFPNDRRSTRAWQIERAESPGAPELQPLPNLGQQSYRPLQSTRRNETFSPGPDPAQDHYPSRRVELPTASNPMLPLWRRQMEELHFGS